MPQQTIEPTSRTDIPTLAAVRRAWTADRCIRDSTAAQYLRWIKRFRTYCAQCELDERLELTRAGAERFTTWYASHHRVKASTLRDARSALYALRRVYQVMGESLPPWTVPSPAKEPATPLLAAYADYLRRHRGNPAVTVHKKLQHAGQFQDHLARHGRDWQSMRLTDIDAFLIDCAQHYARSTVADLASSVRCFTRFLFATGRISADLAEAVIAPVQPRHERPRRALSWDEVQRLLHAVDVATARGRRDYTLLLMMSTYGFGAGEVIRLELQDIDWVAGTLNIRRPKTGVAFTLPLLPAVGKALAEYLRNGRPPATPTRHVFVRMKMPFGPLRASSAVRHILIKHAQAAGLDAAYLGSHVLRHSNAARQVDLGVHPQVLSDLLGHRDPTSISAYVRIATHSLREISLPVPV